MSAIMPSTRQYRSPAIHYEPGPDEKEKNVADLFRLAEEAAMHEAGLKESSWL